MRLTLFRGLAVHGRARSLAVLVFPYGNVWLCCARVSLECYRAVTSPLVRSVCYRGPMLTGLVILVLLVLLSGMAHRSSG